MCLRNTIYIHVIFIILFVINTYADKSSKPLIKNVRRGGIHFEGPTWAQDERALYWVDILDQKVYRLDCRSGNITSKRIAYGPVSLVVRVKDYPQLLAVTVRSEIYLMSWNGTDGDSSLRLLAAVDLGLPDNRFNDGKVDAKGRLWAGTMGKEVDNEIDKDQGSLYLVAKENYINPVVKVRPVSVSNGIAWTSDNKYMFYIDTPTRNVDVFDFDLDTGHIRNRRTVFSFQANNVTGLPDGMTIDTDENLWVACFNGGKVIKIDPRAGKLLEQHKLPASKVSSVMWGGKDYSTLFVTTSKAGMNAMEIAREPEAGSLFAIQMTGSRGYPEHQFIFPNADQY